MLFVLNFFDENCGNAKGMKIPYESCSIIGDMINFLYSRVWLSRELYLVKDSKVGS